jgi:hypothetical protein
LIVPVIVYCVAHGALWREVDKFQDIFRGYPSIPSVSRSTKYFAEDQYAVGKCTRFLAQALLGWQEFVL